MKEHLSLISIIDMNIEERHILWIPINNNRFSNLLKFTQTTIIFAIRMISV